MLIFLLVFFGIIGGTYMLYAIYENLTVYPLKGFGDFFGRLGCLGGLGLFFWFAILIASDFSEGYKDDPNEKYDNTPSEWGPGVENPGYHNVKGYYRSDGTYVQPHIRSNPDGTTSNNLNK